MSLTFNKVLEEIGKVGATGCYIKDFSFKFVSEIPGKAALKWVQEVAPDARLGGHKKASGIKLDDVEDDWSAKHFVVVAIESNKITAIQKGDIKFHVMQKVE